MGRGHGCWVVDAHGDSVFLMDLPSAGRVKELGGAIELPIDPPSVLGGKMDSTVANLSSWPGYSLEILLGADLPNPTRLVIERPQNADRVVELAKLWGPLHFISVSANLAKASTNLLRSSVYLDPLLPGGHRWTVIDATRSHLRGIPAAYNAARSSSLAGNSSGYWRVVPSPSDIVVFLHDDVHLLPNFEQSLYEQVHRLNTSEVDSATWCGIAMAGARVQGALDDSIMRGKWLDFGMAPYWRPMQEPVQEARILPDEAMIVTLRGSAGQFDSQLNEFHCYGADFALSCLSKGKLIHITDTFVSFHKTWHSSGNIVRYNPDFDIWLKAIDQGGLKRAGKFVTQKWMHTMDLRRVGTTACPIDKGILP